MIINVMKEGVELAPVIRDGEDEIITVFLFKDAPTLKNFRCVNCGKLIFQYEGKVGAIFDGGSVPKSVNTVEIMCGRCKTMYRVVQ